MIGTFIAQCDGVPQFGGVALLCGNASLQFVERHDESKRPVVEIVAELETTPGTVRQRSTRPGERVKQFIELRVIADAVGTVGLGDVLADVPCDLLGVADALYVDLVRSVGDAFPRRFERFDLDEFAFADDVKVRVPSPGTFADLDLEKCRTAALGPLPEFRSTQSAEAVVESCELNVERLISSNERERHEADIPPFAVAVEILGDGVRLEPRAMGAKAVSATVLADDVIGGVVLRLSDPRVESALCECVDAVRGQVEPLKRVPETPTVWIVAAVVEVSRGKVNVLQLSWSVQQREIGLCF